MSKPKIEQTSEQIAMRVSTNTIIGNVFLTVIKLLAGLFDHSYALLSDAVHSLSDVLSTVVVIVGVKLSHQAADKEHPYGHERLECVAAIVLSMMLLSVGIGIGWVGIQNIIAGEYSELTVPGGYALLAAVLSILVNEAMYWYKYRAAKKLDSSALMADAWHHRSDALSSIGSFIGVYGARMGFPIIDPIASIVICLFILKASYDIFCDAISKMTDKSADEYLVLEIRQVILSQEGVIGIDLLKTRLFGSRIYIDVDILVEETKSLREAHDVAQCVHDAIETAFPKIKHCTVHVEPYGGLGESAEISQEPYKGIVADDLS